MSPKTSQGEREKISLFTAIKRGSAGRCPSCGQGDLFSKWGVLVEKCSQCGLAIRPRDTDTWFFMYMTTAAITGVFIIVMLLFTPHNQTMAKVIIAITAMLVFFLSMPARKGMAIGIEYYVDSRSEFKKF